jgi:hypothetical protein
MIEEFSTAGKEALSEVKGFITQNVNCAAISERLLTMESGR